MRRFPPLDPVTSGLFRRGERFTHIARAIRGCEECESLTVHDLYSRSDFFFSAPGVTGEAHDPRPSQWFICAECGELGLAGQVDGVA